MLEPWITPSIFEEVNVGENYLKVVDEYTYAQYVDPIFAKERLERYTGCGSVTVTPLLQYYCCKGVTVTLPHPVCNCYMEFKIYFSPKLSFFYSWGHEILIGIAS